MTSPPGLSTLELLSAHLNDLVSGQHLSVSGQKSGEDGRSVSIRNEDEIKQRLIKHFDNHDGQLDGFSISCPTSTRCWYDFTLVHQETNFLVPVNIKSTTGSSADNCGSKEGIFYSLTGQTPSTAICKDYDTYFEYLRIGIEEALKRPERQQQDYYFLVCLKSHGLPPKFFVQTLRSIESFTPNGNNLPFQCAWARNQHRVHRSFANGVLEVLSAYQASMQLRAAQYSKFQASLDSLIRLLAGLPQI